MLIGVETTPRTKLNYFPTERQAHKWLKKHPGHRVLIVPDNHKPTKIDLEDIWRRNNRLSPTDCQLHWYEQHKEGTLA